MHAESAANRKCLCLNSSESGKVCRRRICSDFYFDKAVMTCRVRLRFFLRSSHFVGAIFSHLTSKPPPPSPPTVGALGVGWDSRPCRHLPLLQPHALEQLRSAGPYWALPRSGVGIWAQGAACSLQSCCCPQLLPHDAGLPGALPQQDPAPHPGHSAWPGGLIKCW